MGHVRFTDLQTRPLEVLDLTSLTLDEFRRLGPPFKPLWPSGASMGSRAQPAARIPSIRLPITTSASPFAIGSRR